MAIFKIITFASLYIRLRDVYKRLKQEFDAVISVPDEWEKTGLSKETLRNATIHLPVDGKTSAYKVLNEMENRLFKAKYVLPVQGNAPPVNRLLWIDV